jgi:DNA-binding GntR family transcriptional regulator
LIWITQVKSLAYPVIGRAIERNTRFDHSRERHSPLSLQFGKHFENVSTRKQAVAEHRAIVKALDSRNPAAAKQAMQRHLRHAHNRLTKQIEGDTRKGPEVKSDLKE